MRFLYLAFIFSTLSLLSCNNSQSTTAGKRPAVAAVRPQSRLSDDGTQMLMTVMGKYYALKNGLVATKAGTTDTAAMELTTTAESLRTVLQKDSANYTALKPYVDTILMESEQITSLKDESCERQRLAFEPLSSAMFGLLKNVDLKHGGVYREFCPMAFNGKGAFWLSEESEIKNPYFGKKMLECGEATDSL